MGILKILLVAPEFSDDFVTDCEMDIEMNLSLITASTLSKIFEAFKTSKHKVFFSRFISGYCNK